MTISIDGKKHKGRIRIRNGVDFPRPYRSRKVENPIYGECLIYVTAVGIPYWVDPLTVEIPYEYYITEVIKPNAEHLKKRRMQKSGLKLIEG